jgi:hypothetical protein
MATRVPVRRRATRVWSRISPIIGWEEGHAFFESSRFLVVQRTFLLCVQTAFSSDIVAEFILLYLIHTFYYVKMVDQYCFLANLLNLTCSICSIMAGIFERLVRSPMRAEQCDRKAMELQTAKEILAEVFGVKLSEVEVMILSRFEAAGNEDIGREENETWPQEFCL